MKCKACGKELIGKEKLLCKSCWSKGKDKATKGAMTIGGIVGLAVISVVATKGKFKGGDDD